MVNNSELMMWCGGGGGGVNQWSMNGLFQYMLFLPVLKNECILWVNTRTCASKSFCPFFYFCSLGYQSCGGFLINKKVKNLSVLSLITAKYCKGYWLACLFCSPSSCQLTKLLAALLFLEKNLPSTGRKKNMLSSSVTNTEGSELKTVPVILKEISAA